MIDSPVLPQVLLVAGLVIVFAGMIFAMSARDKTAERRGFWVTWALAGTVMSLSGLQSGWGLVALMAGVIACGVVFWAYFRTDYLKIGGRIYAFRLQDSQPDENDDKTPPPPPDAYPALTAPKQWWSLAFLTALAAAVVFIEGIGWLTVLMAVGATVVLGGIGKSDADGGFPIAAASMRR